MKNILSFASALGFLALCGSAAAQSFTYSVESSKAIITGFATGTYPSGAVVVPTTLGSYPVTEIGRAAFKDRTGITAISFASGATVTRIGTGAFQGCTGLQTISLPAGTTSLPASVLSGCTSLTSTTLPATVTSIGEAAFADCRALAAITLPTALTSLGEAAFSNCRSLTAMTIPTGITVVPGQLFHECRALASVSLPAGITRIDYNAFYNCAKLTSFILPAATVSLGNDAFRDCSGLTSVEIKAALATLGDQAFEGCSALSAIQVSSANTTYSSSGGVLFNRTGTTLLLCPAGRSGSYVVPSTVTTLAAGAFSHCALLTGLTLPSSLTTIPADALYYASGPTSLDIPASVASIGDWALAGCSRLKNVTLPESITSIGNDAFHHCTGLTAAIFNGNTPATLGSRSFDHAAGSFSVYYYSGKSGFASPTWLGYPASVIEAPAAIVNWLANHGYTPTTPLLTDANQDGVSLLMAYALGLDPNANLAASMPRPVLTSDGLSLTFQGNSASIRYAAQTSRDLRNWTSQGVTVSAPDTNGQRTAIATTADGPLFMRLVVDSGNP